MLPAAEERKQLGTLFFERGLISQEQLEAALEEQRTSGARLGEVLVAQGAITRLALANALLEQWKPQPKRPPLQAVPTTRSPEETVTDTSEAVADAEGEDDEALRIARRRYAAGEITRKEFLQLRDDLAG